MENTPNTDFLKFSQLEKYGDILNDDLGFVIEEEKMRSSNSALEYNNLYPSPVNPDPTLTIDRFSFVIKSPLIVQKLSNFDSKREAFHMDFYEALKQKGLIKRNIKECLKTGEWNEIDAPINCTQNYHYHYRLECGIDLQLFPRRKIRKKIKAKNSKKEADLIEEVGHSLHKRTGEMWVQFSQQCFARFDWNPNKNNIQDAHKVLKMFRKLVTRYEGSFDFEKDVWVTRYDLAIDYREFVDLNGLYHNDIRTHNYWGSKTHGTETVYFGNDRSELSITCYNKALEQKRKEGKEIDGSWYRIEAKCKKTLEIGRLKSDKMSNCFLGLMMIKFPKEKIPANMTFFLHYAERFGTENALAQFKTKPTRIRHKKLLEQYECNLREHPNIVALKQINEVWHRFKNNLKNAFMY